MAALTDLSDVINRITGGSSGTPESIWFAKNGRIAGVAAANCVAGYWYSLWTHDGQPGPGAAPTTWAIPDNTTNGGLYQADPGGGREKWLLGASAMCVVGGTLMLYDRLGHIGNLSGTTTTAQTFSGDPTRDTDGVGNIAWLEIYTQIGVSSTTVVVHYDDVNNAGRTSPTFAIGNTNFREVTRMLMMPLAAGDRGVKLVDDVDLTATTGTAGAFGLTIAHPLLYLPVPTGGIGVVRDLIAGLPAIQEVETDACLAWAWLAGAVNPPEVFGGIAMIEA